MMKMFLVLLCLLFPLITWAQDAFDIALAQRATYFDFDVSRTDTTFKEYSSVVEKIEYFDSNDIKRRSVKFYENGNIDIILNYDSKGNGSTLYGFDENGAKSLVALSMGAISINIEYSPDGRLKSYSQSYDLGPFGYSSLYCTNGLLYGEAFSTLEEYETTRYHCNGSLKERGRASHMGEKDGEWEYWDENGILIRKEIYDNGELIESVDFPE